MRGRNKRKRRDSSAEHLDGEEDGMEEPPASSVPGPAKGKAGANEKAKAKAKSKAKAKAKAEAKAKAKAEAKAKPKPTAKAEATATPSTATGSGLPLALEFPGKDRKEPFWYGQSVVYFSPGMFRLSEHTPDRKDKAYSYKREFGTGWR